MAEPKQIDLSGVDLSKPIDLSGQLPEPLQQLGNYFFGQGAAKWEQTAKQNEQKLQENLKQMQTLQGLANSTKEERDAIQAQLNEIETKHLSADEIARRKQQELEAKHKAELQEQKDAAANWQRLHHQQVAHVALSAAAQKEDAFDPMQVINMMSPLIEIEEATADGKPTQYVPKVNWQDDEGKPIKLSVNEGVAKFIEKNPNLSRGKITAGPGGDVTILGGEGEAAITQENLDDPQWMGDPKNWEKVKRAMSGGGRTATGNADVTG